MPNNMILLETIALTQSAASVTFDNLPTSGYTDLKVVTSLRGTSPFATMQLYMTFNGSTTGYSARQVYGDGTSATSATLSNSGAAISIINMNTTQSTANTFSSTEIYIPNYRSSNNKSVSADSVTENNATGGALAGMTAGLWSNSAAITSITFTNQSADTFLANSTFSLYGIAALGTTPVLAPKATGGNIVANDGTYWYHAFLSSGNFVPQTGLTADVLVVAGGGGGGYERGGGGAAGGLLAFTSQSLANGTNYACTVGSGGGAGTGYSNVGNTNGNDSQFGSFTLVKGGGYGGSSGTAGGAGGSAGGSGMNTTNTTVITNPSVSGQGFAGGSGGGTSSNYAGGGGGGATAVGANANPSTGGAGASAYSSWGLATLTGQNVSGTYWYAGGGGGGREYTTSSGGNGGGGGGSGSGGSSGIANTGGGGGGGSFYGFPLAPAANAGAGGSGIIIIRYPIA